MILTSVQTMNITIKLKAFLQSDLTREAGAAQDTEVLQQAVQNDRQPGMITSSWSPGVCNR